MVASNPMMESDGDPRPVRPSRQTKMSREQLLAELHKLIEYYSTTANTSKVGALVNDLRDLVHGLGDK